MTASKPLLIQSLAVSLFVFIASPSFAKRQSLPAPVASDDGGILNIAQSFEKSGDLKQALQWYQKGAMLGMDSAQYHMGLIYENGRGVTADYKKAFNWYQEAARQGNADAQYKVANFLMLGLGVEKNNSLAFSWLSNAAKQDHADSQANLANFYLSGDNVTQDTEKATQLYYNSCINGNTRSCYSFNKLVMPN